MAKVPFDAERGQSTIELDADRIVIIEDKEHPRYDARIDMPLSEAFLASVAEKQWYPVVVFKNEDGEPEIVDGRRRLRAIRELNKRKPKGEARHMVGAIYLRIGADEDMNEVVNAARQTTNLHEGDSISRKAREAHRHMERFGWSAARTAILFGVTPKKIEQYREILDCAAPVLSALDDGRIGIGAAVELAPLSKADQIAKLAEISEGRAPTRETNGNGKKEHKTHGRPGIAAIKKLKEEYSALMTPAALAVVKYVLGETDLAGLAKDIPGVDGGAPW